MDVKRINLTDAEWNVMECLWEKSPRTGRELTEALGKRCGWSRSTVLTLAARLEAKGAVGAENGGRLKAFRPLVSREEAALRETEDLLSRAYQGSLSLLVSTMARRQSLSRAELDELYAILKEAEGKSDA